jgi:carboxymethylenebutenolidase
MPDILIQGGDGFFSGYRAPARAGKGPGIVLIQEIFGVNKVMRDTADWLAGEGYTVVCPDLFWRQEPGVQLNEYTQAEWDRAFAFYKGFSEEKGVEDIKATLAFLRKDDAVTGRVGAMGYCLGGKLAYLTATRTDADCAVGYYGVGIERNLDEAGNLRKPLLLHIAKADKFVPPEAQEKVHRALDAHSKVSIFDYQGCDHAFARKGGDHYDAAAADQANARTLAFFKRHLVSPVALPDKPPEQPQARPTAARPAAKPAAPKPAPPKPAAKKRAAKPAKAAKKPAKKAAKKLAKKAARKTKKPARKRGRR